MIKWVKNVLGLSTLEAENRQLKIQLEQHRKFVNAKIAELQRKQHHCTNWHIPQ